MDTSRIAKMYYYETDGRLLCNISFIFNCMLYLLHINHLFLFDCHLLYVCNCSSGIRFVCYALCGCCNKAISFQHQ